MKNKSIKAAILIGVTVLSTLLLFMLSPIAQDPSYHHFADTRMIMGIPNFYNVISNLPFLIFGISGLYCS